MLQDPVDISSQAPHGDVAPAATCRDKRSCAVVLIRATGERHLMANTTLVTEEGKEKAINPKQGKQRDGSRALSSSRLSGVGFLLRWALNEHSQEVLHRLQPTALPTIALGHKAFRLQIIIGGVPSLLLLLIYNINNNVIITIYNIQYIIIYYL